MCFDRDMNHCDTVSHDVSRGLGCRGVGVRGEGGARVRGGGGEESRIKRKDRHWAGGICGNRRNS